MKYFKRKILQYLTRNLLKAVNEDDILRITSQGYLLRNRKLTPEEIISIKEEAKSIRESEIWRLMTTELEYVAFIRGRKAKTDEDNLATHYLFYNIDLMQQFLNNIIK
ncbi:MAG TPA: hypothetical protein ENI23_07165 [bacterium]|nr:hypothetical protein [bacterium]